MRYKNLIWSLKKLGLHVGEERIEQGEEEEEEEEEEEGEDQTKVCFILKSCVIGCLGFWYAFPMEIVAPCSRVLWKRSPKP